MNRPAHSPERPHTKRSLVSTRSLLGMVLVVLPLACQTGCSSSESPLWVEKVVFRSNRTGDYEIYSINPDGSGLQQLTFDPAQDTEPSLAPDGRIVFHSNRGGLGYELYTMALDGSDVWQVTDNESTDSHPEWSPDGRRIAFERFIFWGGADVFVMNRDGSAARNVTNSLEFEYWPRWSPDGSSIFFNRSGDIYVIHVDGSGITRLTSGDPWDEAASCSPDGRTVAFGRNDQIFLMDVDGSNPRQIVTSDYWDWEPVWSPDGSKIVFVRSEYNGARLMVINADGSDIRDLTGLQPGSYNTCPDWKRVFRPPGNVRHVPTGPGQQ